MSDLDNAMKRVLREDFEQATEIKPGNLYMVAVLHDEDCPAIKTQREGDCVCEPDYELHRHKD